MKGWAALAGCLAALYVIHVLGRLDQEAQIGLEVAGTCVAAGWFAGYGWALYRAVGWVDRMRRWAGQVADARAREGIAWAELDGRGTE